MSLQEGNLDKSTLSQDDVMTEAEIVVQCLQAKEYRGLPADPPGVRKKQGRTFSSERACPGDTLIWASGLCN